MTPHGNRPFLWSSGLTLTLKLVSGPSPAPAPLDSQYQRSAEGCGYHIQAVNPEVSGSNNIHIDVVYMTEAVEKFAYTLQGPAISKVSTLPSAMPQDVSDSDAANIVLIVLHRTSLAFAK